MLIEIPDDLIKLHARKYGNLTGEQIRSKAVEECGELIVATKHYEDGKAHVVDVADECADVIIVAAFLLADDGYVENKLLRLGARLRRMPDA